MAPFFDPKKHLNHTALLIEPRSIARDVPSVYMGEETRRDEVTARVTVFATMDELRAGSPASDSVQKITHRMLAADASRLIGGAFPTVVASLEPKRKGFVWRAPSSQVAQLLKAYYDKRGASQPDPVPSFDEPPAAPAFDDEPPF
ncbi:hypothetical protein Afil01_62310 [Actinorhabdospora filicis]|uniref:Uncharacterized protein n=1 Tax=Actinorhabdospora filicis TaxID=1785913 RepID=A0A9W6WC97_9ACTN|nr:hypothetical protein [Actinorhabdospora filicis]GLZ81424.1 hypothetical protein Afil01_62310 [Actinorhabdospora filicis]